MRLGLKSYVYYGPIEDGMVVRAGASSFVVKPARLVAIATQFLENLDGAAEVETVLGRFPAAARPALSQLLEKLVAGQMLYRSGEGDGALIGEDEAEQFRDVILYLQDRVEDFGRVFRSWRTMPIVVAGDGNCLRIMVQNLIDTGVQNVLVLAPGDAPAPFEVDQIDLSFRAAACTIDFVDWSVLKVQLPQRILYGSDDLSGRGAAALALIGDALPHTHVWAFGIVNARGIIGPWSQDADATRWSDVAARVEPEDESGRCAPSAELCGVVASCAALELLKCSAGIDPGRLADAVLDVDSDLQISLRDVCRGPGSPIYARPLGRSGPRVSVASGVDPNTSIEQLKTQLSGLLDPHFGVIVEAIRDARVQIPLPHGAFYVRRTPASRDSRDLVLDWGLSPEDAYIRALHRALERYAANVQPPEGSHGGWVAHQSEAGWSMIASSQAVVHSKLFAEEAQWNEIEVADLRERDPYQLFQVASILSAQRARVVLGAIPWVSAAYAGVVYCKEHCFYGIGATPSAAIREALGCACSVMQRGAQAAALPANLASAAAASRRNIAAVDVEGSIEQQLNNRGYTLVSHQFTGDPWPSAAGMHIGRKVLACLR